METMNFQEFLTNNADTIKNQLNKIVNPDFKGFENPKAYKKDLENLLKLKRNPFPTQATIISAGIQHLRKNKSLLVSSEMGTGKTIMGIAMSYLLYKENGGNVFLMSPSHLVPKWADEIEKTLGKGDNKIVNYEIVIVKNYLTMTYFKNIKKEKGLIRFFICSKETAKLSYPREEASLLHNYIVVKTATNWQIKCASCGGVLKEFEEIPNDLIKSEPQSLKLMIKIDGDCIPSDDQNFLQSRVKKAEMFGESFDPIEKCKKCRKVYIPKERQHTFGSWYSGTKKEALKGVNIRIGVAEYIKKQLPKGFINLLILDEIHELKGGDTAQGYAFGQLASCSKKVVGLTGTLLNGYASSLFYILYRMNPQLMLSLGFSYNDTSLFVEKYGAFEINYSDSQELEENEGVVTRKGRKGKKIKELPKIHPLMIKDLLSMTLFLRLDEMNFKLPNYEEEVIPVSLDDEFGFIYLKYISDLSQSIIEDKGLLGALANDSLSIPDLPHLSKNAIGRNRICYAHYKAPVSDDFVTNKDKVLISEIEKELNLDRNCLVYVTFSNLGVAERIVGILKANFPDKKINFLDSKIKADKRDVWIKENPCDVLVCNPELVKTGLDLLGFPTIIFYETGYNVSTLKQASRRAWRIGQKETCKVKFLTYANTPQQTALALMSKKIKALNSLDGRLVTTERELASFAGEYSIQEQIAQSILRGNNTSSDEIQTNGWSFIAREWNSYEAFYLDLQQNNSLKENKSIVITQEKTTSKKDYLKTHFEEIQSSLVNVTFIENGKRKSAMMTQKDILEMLETDKDNSKKNYQLSLPLF
ncbi:DEAD/DEAH box helicase family protein [Helicobacter pullorum]|uniref:DEAD/DEAH box helicase family protein n=1 Tax=Helicobacter pullorum TaxID=35818 RepID=UPI000816816E|nr:DEAD/DEAH box helicase family protein [Helicobacter pullorum]OCR09813.1 hypothetical protein A7X13_03880 [Helicobacter pullorum]